MGAFSKVGGGGKRRETRVSGGDEDRAVFEIKNVVVVTDKAILASIDGEEVWLPLSECDPDDWSRGDHGTVSIPEWLAEKKGLL